MTFNLFQSDVDKNSTITENKYEKKFSATVPIQESHASISFVNRLKRQAKQSLYINEAEINKNSNQIQFAVKLPGYQQDPSSNYIQFQPNSYPYPLSTFFPFQYEPQEQLKEQKQFTMTFPFDSNYQTTQPIDISNNQNLLYINAIDAVPLYCTYMPVQTTFQLPVMSNTPNYDVFLENTQSPDPQLSYNPFKSLMKGHFQPCPNDFYPCNDGTKCISKSKRCDNNIDCLDASDEIDCTCKDRISREKLCDNYDDCPNGEDELGCFGCPKDSWSCNDSSKKCISIEERCNGNPICKNKKDEINCHILTNSYTGKNYINSIGSYEGFLQKNFQSKWYPVCGYAFSWAKDACRSMLGSLREEIEFNLVSIPEETETGPYLTDDGPFGKVTSVCPNGLAFIRCPIFTNDSRFDQPLRITEPDQNNDDQNNASANKDASYDPIVGIVGGHNSSPLAWPFIIAINKNGHFHCGGVILNEIWILSAAHCFKNFEQQYYDVDAGILRRFSYSPTRQSRYLRGFVIHEHFNPLTLQNDIALGLLNEPLYYNIWVKPVRLPDMYSNFFIRRQQRPQAGQKCIAVGWGATHEGGSDHDHLQEVEVEVINCTQLIDKNRAEICAGYREGGRDACQGDSGGPLMCRVSDWSYDWYVGGIVSHGIGCGRRNQPGAYTRVSHFRNWINSIIYNRNAPDVLQKTRSACPSFSCNQLSPKCLPTKQRCDGVVNCLGAEDEMNCPDFTVRKLLDRLNA